MKTQASREVSYAALVRFAGLALVILCVFFQRRGLMHPTEFAFLGLCIGLQEGFLRVRVLQRWAAPLLLLYSMLPLLLVIYHIPQISRYEGDFVRIVLYTPLPLILVSVQIMVLYVRESARLVSVVLVLALFSTVIGVRRPLDDAVWPWLAGITVLTTLYLMLQYPGMLFQGVYNPRRRGAPPITGRPGGIMRNAFYAVVPLFTLAALAGSVLLYVAVPRLDFGGEEGAHEVARDVEPDRPTGPTGIPNPPPETPRQQRRGPASVSGLAAGVDLGDFGEIKRSNDPALRLQRVDSDSPIESVYLRAFTYATFDGYGWNPLETAPGMVRDVPHGDSRVFPGAPNPRGLGWARRSYRVEILEAGLGGDGNLPLPTEPVAIEEYAEALLYNTASHTVMAPMMAAGDSYVAECMELIATDAQMAAALRGQTPVQPPRPEYLQVPEGLNEQLRSRFQFYERQRQIAEGSDLTVPDNDKGVYVCALDIVRMLHEATVDNGGGRAWIYSLDRRPIPGPDAILRFLDTSTGVAQRYGHCEYFATAMCMLLRCFGVPSRLCAGFHAPGPGEDGVIDVTAAAAHAWVEVYFGGFGWVAFDPTPPEGVPGGESAAGDGDEGEGEAEGPEEDSPPEDDEGRDTEEDEADEPQVEESGDWFRRYDDEDQRRLFERAGAYFRDGWGRAESFLGAATAWMPRVLPSHGVIRALLLSSPLIVVLFIYVRFRRRRKHLEARVLSQMGEGGRERERGLYFQLLMLLARHGFQKRASETPREFAARVLRKGGRVHQPVEELTEMYYGLRFGRDDSLEREFKSRLTTYAEEVRRGEASRSRPA